MTPRRQNVFRHLAKDALPHSRAEGIVTYLFAHRGRHLPALCRKVLRGHLANTSTRPCDCNRLHEIAHPIVVDVVHLV